MRSLPSTGCITDIISGVQWNAGDIRAATTNRLKQFSGLGVEAGDHIVIAYGCVPSFFADLFAIWHSGAVAVCINPTMTERERNNVFSFVKPKLVISENDSGVSSIAIGMQEIPASEKPGNQASTPALGRVEAPDDAPALILFTSGTTGIPKGVVLSYGALNARIELNNKHIPKENMKNTLCILPMHFGHGLIGNCLTALSAGGNLFLMSADGISRSANLADAIDDHQITFLSSTPAFWRIALRGRRPGAPTSVRQISIGSSPVSASLVGSVSDWAGTKDVRVMYGLTEGANWVSGYSMSEHQPEDGYLGQMWGGEAAVGSDDGVQEYGEGEILLRTPSLMTGYLEQPELTESVMREGWYRTGDRGRVTENGDIYLTGRIKEEINRGGMKISPTEIDMLMEKHPDVLEACTFSVPDTIAGELVGIAIILNEGTPTDLSALREWCGNEIRRECVPDYWSRVSEIPKTDRGKIDRQSVRSSFLAGHQEIRA
jgi:acyl-CoA synthetase (AMP-forming)/AMP-acid ligase II